MFISFFLGFRLASWWSFPLALLFMVLIALLFTAVGTALASVLNDMQGFQLIINFLVMPLFFLSGALFPLDNLPLGFGIATRGDPLTYGVDGLRGALIGASHIGMGVDLFVLSLIPAIIALVMVKKAEEIAKLSGESTPSNANAAKIIAWVTIGLNLLAILIIILYLLLILIILGGI